MGASKSNNIRTPSSPTPTTISRRAMASHHLAIAKASFSAGLLRPDPTSVPRDEITAFHSALDRALLHCSPANIQTCKQWLLNNVVSSSNRVGVWGKYLVVLAGSFGEESKPETRPTTSSKRKRLHILYLLNDLFHHTKYHRDSSAAFSTLTGSLQPSLVELWSYAASYDQQKHPKHHKRLHDLLDIWAEHGYYGSDYVSKLREVVHNSALSGPITTSTDIQAGSVAATKLPGREVPFMMPSTHGDPSTPYYDLPAGNLVPHIIPNSTIPLRPDSIKPLQFLAGPADAKLVTALKDFLKDVDRIYGTGKPDAKENEVIDIDELGQTVLRDTDTADIVNGDTYYGWSRTFCQQMKSRNARGDSRSRSPRKRRYSESIASDDSRWSRSRSRSRTPPPRRRRGAARYDSRSRSRSRSRSVSRSREKSYSPQAPSAPRHFPPPHSQHGNHPTPGYPPPPPMQFPPSMPGAPPPPPPNYQGAWPPPPPPPMSHYGSPAPNAGGYPPAIPPGQFPPMHMGPAQPMPPGSYHFPPPHSGARGGGWGQQHGYPPGRWR
ncbi:hypothetical protein BDV59DRAFT_175591 [Aspergillus ambiguus]|uniref:RNA polymerase II-binding domain-containing protein n=1 Tax=Aspergillus ambiguus TaxID=176160 RepID=UPI003CCCBEA0